MRLRRLLATTIAVVPFRRLRTALYGLMPGYEIHSSARIGWLTIIAADRVVLGPRSHIGRGCVVRGPMEVRIGADVAMGSGNRIECGEWHAEFETPECRYARRLVLGDRVLVASDHYFDATGGVEIGEGTWIAGRGSQFWTHGLGVEDRTVSIGRYCYIGSAARFAPGARVGDLVVVGLGSVVTRDLSESRQALIAGVPAAVVRSEYRPKGWAARERAMEEGRIAYE